MNEFSSPALERDRKGIRMACGGRLGRPLAALILLSVVGSVSGIAPPAGHPSPLEDNLDVRLQPERASQTVRGRIGTASASPEVLQELAAGRRALEAALPAAKITTDEVLGSPLKLTSRRGFLTSETTKLTPEQVVRNFVSQHAQAFGLRRDRFDDYIKTDASYQNPGNGQRWVRLKQEIAGIPVFQGELTALVNQKGQLTSLVNGMAPTLAEKAVLSNPIALTAEDAILIASSSVDLPVEADELVRRETSEDNQPIRFERTSELRFLQAERVIFPLGPGEAVLGWQITLMGKEAYLVVVNASDGEILFRKNLKANQTQEATFEYYAGDSPAPFTPYPYPPVPHPTQPPQYADFSDPAYIPIERTTTTTISGLLPANVNRLGWINDYDNVTRGNNVFAYRDEIPGDGVDTDGMGFISTAYGHGNGPSQYNRNFTYFFTPAPTGNQSPSFSDPQYDHGSVTNMFVWVNLFHDMMYRMGFTEPARNFQEQNFGRGGAQFDSIYAESQDFSGTDNASFTTLPDGTPGVMQMFIFPDMAIDSLQPDGVVPDVTKASRAARDSALDQQVMLHELAHGLTNRLVGNASGLSNHQGKGMGEGWSDFYALSILSDLAADNDPDKVYPMGGWITYDMECRLHDNYFYGIRRFPYSTNLLINPLTFAHADPRSYHYASAPDGYYASPDRSLYPESPLCNGASGGSVHNLGEIWASALWQARSHVMRHFERNQSRQGLDPAKATHAVLQRGNEHMLQLVTDGLKLTPTNPTFLEARDAIFEAALSSATNPPGYVSDDPVNPDIAQLDEIALWRGFAERGFGFSAVAPPRNDRVVRGDQYYYRLTHGPECPRNYFPPARQEEHVRQLSDDRAFRFDLRGGFTFYGQRYTKLYVSDDGYVTFGTALTNDERADSSPVMTLNHHFSQPRISALLRELNHDTGQIRVFENADVFPDRVYVIWDQVEDMDGNPNTFSIELSYDTIPGTTTANPQAGRIRINYLDMSTTVGIVGLSRGQSPSGFQELDFSATGLCDMEATGSRYAYYTEEFSDDDGDFDLSGHRANTGFPFESVQSFIFDPVRMEGFANAPQEAYDLPLKVGNPILRKENSEEQVPSLAPGQRVAMHVPLGNEFIRANLSGVIGLLTPLTDGINIVNPVATYGTVVAGGSSEGTPFLIEVGDDSQVLCNSLVQMKLDVINDQQVTGTRVISLRIGEVQNQETPYTFQFPQQDQRTVATVSGDVPDALPGEQTVILLSSGTALKTGVRLKNPRTQEVVEVTQFSTQVQPLQFTVRRGQNGITEPMLDGDMLEFDSIPIPDVGPLSTYVKAQGVTGENGVGNPQVGNVRVTIHEIRHPRLGDLTARLTSPDGRVSVVLFNQLRNSSGQSVVGNMINITFDDDAPINIQTQGEPIPGQSYQPMDRQNNLSGLRAFRDAGVPANGNWTLTVTDGFAPLAGELVSWSISLNSKVSFTCSPTQTAMTSSLASGMNGWFGYTAGDPDSQQVTYNPGSPATLRLTTYRSPQARVPAWQSPGVDLINIPNQIYRFSAWVFRSGQENMSVQSFIPNMRLRAQVRFAMSNMAEYFFDPTQFDPETNEAMLAIAPSTDPTRPTRYFVDFDPVDVPALFDPVQQVRGTIENFSIYPDEHGSLEITEARIERYAAPSDEEGVLLRTYTPEDFAGIFYVSRGNMANPDIFAEGPYPSPTVSVTSNGVTLDSRGVGNEGTSFVTFDFVPADGNDPIIKPGKMYRIRYHVSSSTPSDNNPQFRLRARSIKWSYDNLYEVGSARAAGPENNLIAAQALPGKGTKNPNRRANEKVGGYYDLYFHPPAVLPADPNLRRLRFGFDMIDGVFGIPTPEQIGVEGEFTLDSIEVWEFDAR